MASTESDGGLIPREERPEPIEPLGREGRALWDSVVKDYVLRADELRALSSAAKLADLIARLEKELARSDLLVPGSRPGMLVSNGLINEVRQARLAQASLLRSLKLPDDEDEEQEQRPRLTTSQQNRRNVAKRWERQHG